MTAEQRAEMEARATRALRRGEMTEALALLEAVLRAFPEDEALATRLADLRASASPEELRAAAAPAPRPDAPAPRAPHTPEQEGERLYHLGDYVGAAAAYRRALRERPDSELVRERLEEIVLLAQSAPRHSPTDAALPAEPEARLRALLDRISSRRRIHT
jgi:tetratricopeptide (TPR) repeat protein